MNKKRLAINMLANIISFIVTMGINFFLSPYIIRTVGKEAYGFVGLANNFVSYAQLVTLALNSMAGRFITIKIHQNDNEGANKYFTSVVIANTLMAITMLIPSILVIVFMNRIINIPQGILKDVQLLWIFIFANFLVSLITATFSIATFVKNRLDLSSIRDIQSNILKVIILIVMFSVLKPSVWYLGLSSLICTIFISVYNIHYKKVLLPQINIQKKYFDFYSLKELILSGIWHVIIKLGQILTDGIDLLITNLFIDSASMGILAIAKTVPSAIGNLLVTITQVFSPQLTIHYAKGNIKELIKDIKISMKISGFFTNIALGFTITFGMMFYSLWVPGENIELIQKASIFTIYGLVVSGGVNTLFGVFSLTNKLKVNSFVILANGLLNTIIVFILIKTTNLGILAVAGVSTTTALIRNLTFTPMYSAKCLGVSMKTFYGTIIRYMISSIIVIVVFEVISININSYSWIKFILSGAVCTIIGSIINYFFLFDKLERLYIINVVKSKLNKK
ncbi:hypothetical protein JCM1393_07030 [Clostridium carnis]